MSGATHQDKLDIVAWLEREAAAVARDAANSNSEKAARLREASAEIRKMRSDKVAARFGQRMGPLQAKEPRS